MGKWDSLPIRSEKSRRFEDSTARVGRGKSWPDGAADGAADGVSDEVAGQRGQHEGAACTGFEPVLPA